MAANPPQPPLPDPQGSRGPQHQETKLNLGCGQDPQDGYLNVDYIAGPGVDQVVDLNQTPWPWMDDAFAEVRIHNTLEHLQDPFATILELHRVTQPGGIIDILVPHARGNEALQVNHTALFDEHSLVPFYRGGDGTPGLDTPHLFDLVDLQVTHRHPLAWHQRRYLGRELVAWGPHQVHWRLRVRDLPEATKPQV